MSARDRRLVRRLQRRDERAFRELVRAFQQPVYGFVYRMLDNSEEAEDLAQEVFVSVFKSIGNFRGDSALSTWIYRIATNHCRNRFKYLSRRHHQATQGYDEAAERAMGAGKQLPVPLQAQVPRPDAALDGHRLERALQHAIASLDDDQRLLVILRDVQGLSYQEIASIAGLPEGTVKSRLHRTRMTLKNRLEKML